MAFSDGRLPIECMWQTVFIIPKGSAEFIGIRLVEVLCKTFSGVIN